MGKSASKYLAKALSDLYRLAKEAHFNNSGLLFVEGCEPDQSLIERDQLFRFFRNNDSYIFQVYVNRVAAALCATVRASMIHEDSSHQLRSQCEEVRAVLPPDVLLIYQLQIGFVYKRSRLQCMAAGYVSTAWFKAARMVLSPLF